MTGHYKHKFMRQRGQNLHEEMYIFYLKKISKISSCIESCLIQQFLIVGFYESLGKLTCLEI